MAWEQLAINKPHLAYTILGGFTSIFMLCSLFIKEKLYIGEATVATICGIIFGPVGANLFSPQSWGNVDQITLECARIVLVVQCFAVGVELPKKYMERHWKSVVILLIPVMTFGWLITSLFIWWLIPSLTWLEALTCAACVTATDPVLASSVVGKGKFARRIPKHLRDLLSAESGCNDGMAFPFIFLALYIVQYRPMTAEVFKHWICITILYECVFGAVYGVAMGYIARHMIKFAERRNLIDRESFLVFYFVLALWCAGTGSMLGLDDLLVGFAAGVGFSNDGWFAQKTEDSHVSNVIDLLLNLAFFVFFGSIIPWSSYNRPDWGITPWRLVVIAILVIFFRRIPIMVLLKPLIPDVKTWREALFAGHFGPIGVGAVFVAIMARAELEHENPTPLAELPEPGSSHYVVIQLIWPITTFLILTSILVHGSSIAVFTLGKHINTMRITMSYTTANEEPNWLSRLPRLTPRTSMSIRKPDADESSDEKFDFPPGTLPPPGGVPGGFLARRKEGESDSPLPSRPASIRTKKRRHGAGGPISDTAIAPRRAFSDPASPDTGDERGRSSEEREEDELEEAREEGFEEGKNAEKEAEREDRAEEPRGEFEEYVEGPNVIIENKQGDVIGKTRSPERPGKPDYQHHPMDAAMQELDKHEGPAEVTDERSALAAAHAETMAEGNGKSARRRPAYAFRADGNIIVEDEDGEVIRRYKMPKGSRPGGESSRRPSLAWQGWKSKIGGMGLRKQALGEEAANDDDSDAKTVYSMKAGQPPEKGVNFRMHDERGRRLSKQQFLQQLQKMDPHARAATEMASEEAIDQQLRNTLRNQGGGELGLPTQPRATHPLAQDSAESSTTVAGSGRESPKGSPATASPVATASKPADIPKLGDDRDEETAAERKRREAALGMVENESDSEDEGGEGRLETKTRRGDKPKLATRTPGIRFADSIGPPSMSQARTETTGRDPMSPSGISWSEDVKGKGRE